MPHRLLLATAVLGAGLPVHAIDLAPLWDFSQPALSEQRFRAALAGASPDDALILRTQIARSHGLRGDFAAAQAELRAIEPALPGASAQARARHALEWGRSWASATHPPATQTEASRAQARQAFGDALAIARAGQLDGLAIDALHMMAFLDTAPAEQLAWARQALAIALASAQADARRWQASLHHNAGYALHQLGRLDEALAEFKQALALREQAGRPVAIREARWMVAWTLRAQGRSDDALAMQLQLEAECNAAQAPDPYVYEELALLYAARGDSARAQHYTALRAALPR